MKPSYKICSTQLQLLFSSLGSTPAREVSQAAVIGTKVSLVQSYWSKHQCSFDSTVIVHVLGRGDRTEQDRHGPHPLEVSNLTKNKNVEKVIRSLKKLIELLGH